MSFIPSKSGRILEINVANNEQTVTYRCNGDITDIVSDIEKELESVFGGNWALKKAIKSGKTGSKFTFFRKSD